MEAEREGKNINEEVGLYKAEKEVSESQLQASKNMFAKTLLQGMGEKMKNELQNPTQEDKKFKRKIRLDRLKRKLKLLFFKR